ncbi:MAG TPA: class I SAM-dependent methyltransferase [Bacteroidia bacterium]|nr:class I SAM-dependent methyltransferase [Bacteroidia bacterium]
MDKRLINEIEHGKKIKENAEDIWGWGTPSGKVRAERRSDLLISTANIKNTDYCLEIGCGSGLFTEKIYNKTKCKITAIDLSKDLLELAQKRNLPVEFIEENAMNTSFSNNTFDVVYGSSVIHHLDLDLSLKEIFRVLKPGGRMVFAEPNMINPQIFIQKNVPFIKKWLGDSPDETAIVRWQFKKKMENIGFKNVNIFPYDFLHPITPKFLIPVVFKMSLLLEKIPLIKEIAGSVIIYGEKA